MPIFSRDNGDDNGELCGVKKAGDIIACVFWLIPMSMVGILIGYGILFGCFFPLCAELYNKTVASYTAYHQEYLPTFIEFYAYAGILHPLRRIRVCWRSLISKFRKNATTLNVPRECTFPQELFEIIINFCYPHRQTLLTCSLVCKAWVPTSRRLLWIHVHSGDRVRQLVKLLNSPDSAISPYAQKVSLSMYTKQDRLMRYRHALRTLANADSRIIRAKITGQSLEPARALRRYFPHLRRLSFSYEDKGDIEETSAANFRRILLYSSLFCDLQHLSIQFNRQGNSTEDIPLSSLEEITLPAGLRSLSIKTWNKDFLCWIKRHRATLRLTTFKLKVDSHWQSALDSHLISAILRPCRTSLQFVTLTIFECKNGFLNLDYLTELRVVVFYVYHIPSSKATLSSLNSSHIENITILTRDGENMTRDYFDQFMTGISFSFSYGKSGLRRYVPSIVGSSHDI
ncbi:uncharacterized protein EV420DRAFT_1551259 [Desarmillaria tabescens]|uniref:F-box domain-containing protein n=1 Tax=Armillaria tabescens TaxID=1929756 RepID=A0AA39K9G9_ARMTA|nr:uncharacterized protein EV420DRAFT_1551259 [Desarmillaria tabescens]KAK0457056.1 hypothetical protein EV420DRAFT_1551259 [Desarmillaria tabescens]